jgi:hypothetical protein
MNDLHYFAKGTSALTAGKCADFALFDDAANTAPRKTLIISDLWCSRFTKKGGY